MTYRFTCPGCNNSIVRVYKPKTTVRCTHKGCRITFPVPETSFLNSSLDEQQELLKRNQPRFLPPKAAAHIDINDYLFSEEDSDSEGKEDEDKQDEKEEDEPKLPMTRYERKYRFNQRLIEDGVISDLLYNKKVREQVEDSNVEEVDRIPHKPEFYKDLVFSSEEENEEEGNKDNKKSTGRKGKGKANDSLFPQAHRKRSQIKSSIVDINDYLFSEEDSDSEVKKDIDKPKITVERKLPIIRHEDKIIPKNPVFSSEEESEEEGNKESKRSTGRKGKGRANDFLFSQNNSDSDDDYQDNNEEEEEEEEEEEAGKFDIVFSDIEEDSEEEVRPKKRSKSSKGKEEKPALSDSPSNNKATGGTSESKRKIREVYTAGGDIIRFEVNEDGLEVPILSKKSNEKDGLRKNKYGPKVGNRFNPYIIFNKMERQKIKDLHPGLDNLDLSRKVGEIYAALDPVEKQRYTDMGNKEKEKYIKNFKGEESKLKVPPNAFILFKSRNKERFTKEFGTDNIASDYTRKVADIWKNLPAAEKLEYQKESLRLKQEFKENNPEVYKAKMEKMVKKSAAKRLQKTRDLYIQRK